jgi:hypothetical protein
MKVVGIYIQDSETLEYNRVDLFDDEKISVTSSIQNINDIAKTYTDFSQTFTVPATKQNNKIFKHWYDNSNDFPFSTLVKSNAYIEIDTIPFRKGKIQLESANVIDGQAQDYSITFIGILGNLKDTFAGKYLKDLTSTAYDFEYTADNVAHDIFGAAVSTDVMFPLITSGRRWNYGLGNVDDISLDTSPIRYNELFPAIRLRAVLNMIETQFGINFDGTTEEPSTFLSDARFTNAYLYLNNAEEFKTDLFQQIDFTTKGNLEDLPGVTVNLDENYFIRANGGNTIITITPQTGFTTVPYTVKRYLDGEVWTTYTDSDGGTSTFFVRTDADNKKHSFYIETTQSFEFEFQIQMAQYGQVSYTKSATMSPPQILSSNLSIITHFPEIKIEDFFSGLLKMFNLTCYSSDGINYTVEQLESYYNAGSDIDITKYVLQDKKALNRVKTYKRINFEYEKSESFINVDFNSRTGIEYGSLYYQNNPITEGEEYSVKLPFENLNFSKLSGFLQVGYCLKTDLQKYIPKPVILYDYSRDGLTNCPTVYFSNALIGNGSGYNQYKAFGQETLAYNTTYGLNFPPQQSTLTLEIIENGLYQQYYQQYFANIYNYKARLIKLSAILPTSVLTTLKLNDSIIIRDSKYLINTYTTDLTTGLVQFELLTDERVRIDLQEVNTFIGGVSSTISTDSLLATKLGISVSAISKFSIDGSNISCRIEGNYNIPASAFANNTNITYFDDSDGLVNIINNTAFFGCTALSYIEFPNVTNIISSSAGGTAGTFQNCTSLISFSTPKLVTLSGTGSAFFGCTSLISLSFPLSNTSIPTTTFYNCSSLTLVDININGNVGVLAFAGTKITSINLSNATSIGNDCFNSVTTLVGAINANLCTNLGSNSFKNTRITSISLNLLTHINVRAFYDCISLTSISIPEVLTIDSSNAGGTAGTFQNCTSLTSFIAPKLTTIQNNGYFLLASCSSINTISMPALTTLGGTVGDNYIFYLIKTGCTITVPIAFQTNNSGSPDGDLQYAITTRGATVTYI